MFLVKQGKDEFFKATVVFEGSRKQCKVKAKEDKELIMATDENILELIDLGWNINGVDIVETQTVIINREVKLSTK